MATATEGLSAGPTEDSPIGSRVGNAALILLIWLFGASGVLLLYLGSKLTFLLDDWEFLLYRPGFHADTVLDPHGEHIVVLPVLIYKALLATFGMGSALPFRVVSTVLFLISAAALFVILERRVGQWPALAGTAVVLFLGAAWEDLLWSFQLGFFGGMAAGLGMLLALERGDRRGDGLACLLLTVSILFSSLGLPFAAGAAVQVLRRSDRWRRLYVVAIPLAVYAAWWLGWGHTAENAFSASNVVHAPEFVFDGLAAALASGLGLVTPAVVGMHGGLNWGRPIAAIAIGLALWRLYRLRRIPEGFLIVFTIAAAFWILAAFNQTTGREPVASRYQYLGVIFVLLMAAELLRGVRFGTPAKIAILLVAAASVASNIVFLNDAYSNGYHPVSQLEKAGLGAVEIARATVEPGFVLSEELVDTGFVHVEAAPYLSARDAYGSPAYGPAEIADSPAFARFAADKVLFGALRIGLAPAAPSALRRARHVAAQPTADGQIPIPAGACVSLKSSKSVSPLLSLPRAGAAIRSSTPIADVRMSRFATGAFPIELSEGVPARHAVKLATPPDRSTVPWKIQLETAGPSVVCGLGGPSAEDTTADR